MGQVSVIAKLVAKEGKRDELVEQLSKLVAAVQAEPGTLVYSVNLSTTDPEVAGIADHRFGAECLTQLEVLLEPAGLVGAVQLGTHTARDHPGGEAARCAWHQLAIKDEHHLVGAPYIQVVADDALEEGAPGLWAIEHAGVEPDIVCVAKGIASGMPLSVCMAKAHIMDWVPGSHASTYGGNPVCIAAALATLNVIEREGVQNAATVGAAMLERMKTWVDKYPNVGDVRGRGLMLGIEIVGNRSTKTAAPALSAAITRRCLELGLHMNIVQLPGLGGVFRLAPPLTIAEAEVDRGLSIIEQAIEESVSM